MLSCGFAAPAAEMLAWFICTRTLGAVAWFFVAVAAHTALLGLGKVPSISCALAAWVRSGI